MLVVTEQDAASLLEFINANDILAYDTEATGLNTRKDTVIGFGCSNAYSGFYVPLYSFVPGLDKLVPFGIGPELVKIILEALSRKKLLMFNASFDARMTKQSLKHDLLPALHADVLLMKHTCDEEFPFGLKEIATKLWGHDVKKEKEELKESIKANGGAGHQYYKADVSVLSRYCVQDCLLTFRIYNYYRPRLESEGLADFYFKDEVMPLYKFVTIPMEEQGIKLDIPRISQALTEINEVLATLEKGIQAAILPHLDLFRTWFLNKDYPLKTYTGKAPAWTKKYETQFDAWTAENQLYMFNLQSKHHLKKLFFDTLKEEPLSRTEKGNPQVDEEFLDLMALKYDWCSKLIEFNKLTKIKGTYILRFLVESEDGYYYPSFQQHRTVSGRYASDMQQLPRPLEPGKASENIVKFTSAIREFLIARPGMALISADYEQLEPSIFAHTSRDPTLQEIFNAGTDFYSEVAIRTEQLSNYSSDKNANNYLAKLDKARRQKAKAYALGIAYGMTGYKLKFELNVSEEEANKLVEDYLTAFPKLKEWMYASRDTAKVQGYIRAQTGRVRHMPQVAKLFTKYGPSIDNDLELWKSYHHMPGLYAEAKADRKIYKNLLNNAINFQVQSLAASIVNRAAIALAKQGIIPLLQIHDELVYEAYHNDTQRMCAIIKQTMENVIKLDVPLRTTPQYGANYRLCK